MLEYYYDIHHKDKFQQLFAKYYIGQNPTPLANTYRILFFNFSGIDTTTAQKSYQGFYKTVQLSIESFLARYNPFNENQKISLLQETTPELILKTFFERYAELSNPIPIYLLIDEYDHFTNEILIRNLQEFKATVSQNGYVRKFYEVIKNATQQGIVDRVFITGVSPLTLDSLTSGFNILKHLTHNPHFETMIGFSENEVQSLVQLIVPHPAQQQKLLQDLRHYYNGYKFCPPSSQTLYNPDMVLYFLDHFQKNQTYPRQMLDPNIMPDYGKLKQIFEVVDWRKNQEVLEEVLEQGKVSAKLVYQFQFEKPWGKMEFISLLYYLGNLTIEGEDVGGWLVFRIPNKVIAELYWEYYAYLLEREAQWEDAVNTVPMAIRQMALSGNAQAFFEELEALLQRLSNRDFRRMGEKHVKMVMMALLMQGGIFDIYSERELEGGGYVDMELYVRANSLKEHHQFALEVKYLRKEQEGFLAEVM
ncbi:MAG: AAA family ATPase, partial [Bacteroidia bacterium]|nr:AAA family ATPase [Bacteroidia bacterium]